MRARRVTALLALLLLGGSAFAVAVMRGDSTVAGDPSAVYRADGCDLDDSPEQAAIFPGNTLIVLGTVQGQEADRIAGRHMIRVVNSEVPKS